MDPENGDFSLSPGSPAAGYGCQTFSKKRAARREALAGAPPPGPAAHETGSPVPAVPAGTGRTARRDQIVVSGPIIEDTTWEADTVIVMDDVLVENGVTLTIAPGTRVEFQGYDRLAVSGTLIAAGKPDQPILFTTHEPGLFRVDRSTAGAWNGIRFHGTPATNAASRLEHCILEFSKAVDTGREPYLFGGGAVSAHGFSKLVITCCVFRNNVAEYGGAIFLYRQSSPDITNNLITGNHALGNASAVYCAYAYPLLLNNTIVGNTIHNEEDPYIETAAVVCFLAKPVFENNIIRNNDPVLVYMHGQLWENKDYCTQYNDIEDGDTSGTNIDADPLFRHGPLGDWYLSRTAAGQPSDSPCADAGSGQALDILLDLGVGSRRLGWLTTRTDGVNDDGQADMGYHYPWQSVSAALGCTPASGTLPFDMAITVSIGNRFAEFGRRAAARIDVLLAGGPSVSGWRSGHTILGPAGWYQVAWSQHLPALGALAGPNVFTMTVEDVTPSPYNQPPYPPSGDTSVASCTVTGIGPWP